MAYLQCRSCPLTRPPMPQVEIIILFLPNDDEALFVNGLKIYSVSGYDACMSAHSLGDALAETLGVVARTIEAPMPKKPVWIWEEVYAALDRRALPARAVVTGAELVAHAPLAATGASARPQAMKVAGVGSGQASLAVAAAPVTGLPCDAIEAKVSIERHPQGHDAPAVTVCVAGQEHALRIYFDEQKYLICTDAGVEVITTGPVQA